jgi:hypothetical protein
MPQVRKLSPEEVYALENKGKGQRKITEELYDTILADYAVGDYGEAVLEENDNRLTVRNRLKAAAKRRGVSIDFRRTSGDLIRFQVVAGNNGNGRSSATSAAAPQAVVVSSDTPPAPAKRKGGRPKKNP